MRAIWTGALSFGLVNIPVRLYPATEDSSLSFHYLHKRDLSPIRYARVCRADGKEIPFEEVVKGYEYEKGDYVVLTDADFKKANARATSTVEILDFVDTGEIDNIYFEKPYYLEPEKGAAKAYLLLREALLRSGKVGVATFVLRNQEHLAIIKPEGKALVLIQMRFNEEIKSPKDLNLPTGGEAKDNEIEMAIKLIDQLSEPFRPEHFKDTYASELKSEIKGKLTGKPRHARPGPVHPTGAVDLMAALRRSLEKAR